MAVFRVLLIILIVLLILSLGFSYYCYRVVFYSPADRKTDDLASPTDAEPTENWADMSKLTQVGNIDYEAVSITSFDNLTLYGKYYEIEPAAPLDIFFHGYRGSGLIEFYDSARAVMDIGHNVLIVDQRAHLRSGGCTISFGINERFDVVSWVNYALERFGDDTEINIIGESMGAATVLMASGLDLPANVTHIVADCPYSSPRDIIESVAEKKNLPSKLIFPFIRLGAFLFGRFDLCAVTAADAIKTNNIPILIIHGEDDNFVPPEMSELIRQASPEHITRETFPGAGHAMSSHMYTERYTQLLTDFLES